MMCSGIVYEPDQVLTSLMIVKPLDPALRIWEKGSAIVPNSRICNCPIATTLGILGKKWTMLVLRDIAMRDMGRFSQLMRGIPGITRECCRHG